MNTESEQLEIELLKRLLAKLELEVMRVRTDLRRILLTKEMRRCQVEIYWDSSQEMYMTRYSRNEVIIHVSKSKKYERGRASVGIESVDGAKPRVSWKQIDSGTPWSASVIVKDYFWDRIISPEEIPPSKVIYMATFDCLRGPL